VLGPDPETAEPELPGGLGSLDPGSGNGFGDSPWRHLVKGRELRKLVDQALLENADLKVAEARVRKARARAGMEAAQRLARLDGVGIGGVSRQSKEENPFPALVNPDRSPMGFAVEFAWEIDWWGRKKRGRQAAEFEVLAVEWDRAALQTEVAAAVVGETLVIQALSLQLESMEQIVELEAQSLAWVGKRVKRGEEGKDAYLEAENRLARVKMEAEKYREDLNMAQRALAEWCGRGTVSVGSFRSERELVSRGPSGDLRAGVVLRRPDVAASTARYRQAVARIGIAEASRWPEVQIVGASGQLSSSLSDLFGNGASTYGLGLDLRVPIFDGGEGRKRTEQAVAAAEDAHASHVGVVLRALREVGTSADRMQSARRVREEVEGVRRIVGEQLAIERRRVASGEVTGEALRRREIEQARAEVLWWDSRRRESVATVDLFRALGGGW